MGCIVLLKLPTKFLEQTIHYTHEIHFTIQELPLVPSGPLGPHIGRGNYFSLGFGHGLVH